MANPSRPSPPPDNSEENPSTIPWNDAVSTGGAEHDSRGESAGTAGGLEQQYARTVAERDDFKDRWLRGQAEFENYRKRVQREAEQERNYQSLPLARDLIPALDNLARALVAAGKTANVNELVQGVQMVTRQIEEILGRHHISRIECVGQPFDPNLHNAIQMTPSTEHAANVVASELERGYVLRDRVVRPSVVIVSSGPPAAQP